MIPRFKTLSRGDIVASMLKSAILKGEYGPGEPLVEREIAARFGTSKTPAREALRSLAASRLIVIDGYKAAIVQPLDPSTIADVFELRRHVEPWAVVNAVDNLERKHKRALEGTLAASVEAVERQDWVEAISAAGELHRLTYAQCKNQIVCDLLDSLQETMLFITVNLWKYKPTWQKEMREHAKIVDAINDGDKQRIHDVISLHIEDAYANVVEMLDAKNSTAITNAPEAPGRV